MKSFGWVIGALWGVALVLFILLLRPLDHEGQVVAMTLSGIFVATSALTALLFRSHRRQVHDTAILERAGLVKYRYGTRSGGLAYSSGVQALLGRSAAELVADPQRWAESIHPDDKQRIASLLAELPAGELFSLEYRIRHADGHWLWLMDRAVEIQQRGGELVIDGIALDITARKEAELAAVAREKDWNELIDQLPVMIFVKDAKSGRYLRSNAAHERITGIPMEQLLGKQDQELWPEAEVFRAQDEEAVATQGIVEVPSEIVHTPLGERWIHTRKVCLRDDRGEPRFVLGMSIDITEEHSLRQRLETERTQMRNLIDAIPDMVFLKDEHGIYREANQAMVDFVGRPRHEILGSTDHDLFPLDVAETSNHYDELVLQSGRANRHTEQRRLANGQTVSFDVIKEPLFDRMHKVAGVVGIARDISIAESAERERNRLLEELAGSKVAQARAEVAVAEDRGRQLVQALSEAVVSLDQQGRVTLFNTAAEVLFGWQEKEVIGRPYHDLVHHTRADGRPYPAEECELLNALRQKRNVLVGTDLFWRRDGRPFTGEYSYLPLLQDGEVSGAVIVTRDVTERERAAQRLRMLSRVVEEGPAAVTMTDARGVIHYVNQRFTEMTGFSETAAIGKTHAMLASGRTPAAVYDDMWRCLNAGNEWSGDLQNRRRDGRPYWQHSLITPLKDAEGKVTHFLAISEDITERRELEAKEQAARERLERALSELGEAKVAAEAAAVAKSQFLANVSHEIRTPMNAIIGLTELVMRTRLDAQQRNYVEKTYRSARLLLGLLNDVLDFSKIEAERLTLDPQPFRIDDLLDQVVDLFGDTAADKELEFIIDLDPELPAVLVGDILRLTQVIANLLSNAIKFTESGEVILRLRRLPLVEADRVILAIGVADTGIGMTQEQSARVFDAFAQGDGSTTRRYGGTGLGLTICRHLVTLMNSQLQLETTPGVGSHFHFAVNLGSTVVPDGEFVLPLSGESALVLAAHPLQRQAVERLLQGMGARPVVAATVAEALAVCRDPADRSTTPLRLVVADEGLMDDPSLIEWLHRLRTTPGSEAPGLVLTWRRHVDSPQGLPPHQLLGRPLTRHALTRAVQILRSGDERPLSDVRPRTADARLSGVRVLVVDDYPLNLEIVTTFLHEAGCVVATAANGQEAVDHIDREPVDVVLMDCQMPVMDGFDATRTLRRQPRWQALPVIAMTANVMEGDREKCFAAGMNDFIGKPVMIENLLEVLVRHVGERKPVQVSPPAAEVPPALVPAAAPVASAPKAGADFSRLQGIDLEAALAATMGKPEFLERVLRIFHTTQSAFDQKFVAAQADAGDPEAAGRTAHTLKGAAASIGAESLRQAALALEQAAKAGMSADEIELRRAAVLSELNPVLEGIRHALSM